MTASDMPSRNDPAEFAEIAPSALPDHVCAALAQEARLDLLLPQGLPTEHALSAQERIELRAVPSLWPIRDLAVSDRWDFSIVRMMNARPDDRNGDDAGADHPT